MYEHPPASSPAYVRVRELSDSVRLAHEEPASHDAFVEGYCSALRRAADAKDAEAIAAAWFFLTKVWHEMGLGGEPCTVRWRCFHSTAHSMSPLLMLRRLRTGLASGKARASHRRSWSAPITAHFAGRSDYFLGAAALATQETVTVFAWDIVQARTKAASASAQPGLPPPPPVPVHLPREAGSR